jgi:hypothetical protein
MNNEPVAFVIGDSKYAPVLVDTVLKVGTPLYTHPVNLTSLEIADAMELVFGEQIEEQFGNDLEEFARAILRKAQEK